MTRLAGQSTSFRLEIEIAPSWDAILGWVTERTGFSRDDIIVLDKDVPGRLWRKAFRFIWFQDRLSGLSMVWSDHDRSFVEEIVAGGHVFEAPPGKRLDFTYLVVNPERIGFTSWYDNTGNTIGVELGRIPSHEIITLLLDLEAVRRGLGMCAIREFPPSLAEDLVETGTVYSTDGFYCGSPDAEFKAKHLDLSSIRRIFCLRDRPREASEITAQLQTLGVGLFEQGLPWHHFENRFYGLALSLHSFSPEDNELCPWPLFY